MIVNGELYAQTGFIIRKRTENNKHEGGINPEPSSTVAEKRKNSQRLCWESKSGNNARIFFFSDKPFPKFNCATGARLRRMLTTITIQGTPARCCAVGPVSFPSAAYSPLHIKQTFVFSAIPDSWTLIQIALSLGLAPKYLLACAV
jgi:hypothetical protein